MGALQPMQLIVVLVIVLLLFGPGKLPELGRAVGDGMRELRRASSSEDEKHRTARHGQQAGRGVGRGLTATPGA